jgi:mono/diheme cytochrome c family protein
MNARFAAHAVLLTLLSACAWTGSMRDPQAAPVAKQGTFDRARVARGAELAALGNCRTCHTADGGSPYAGGKALATPFGTIYSTNITPEAETGIGRWSVDDFRRALHEGVSRSGRQLYPAFPYDHFTRVSDDDVAALYAFTMTREPVQARAPRNRLVFPANIRPLLAAWKWLYFQPGRFVANPQKSAQWNRGAYLVEGIAHCGACHTPRNAAGAEKLREPFAGGEAEGWHAPALLAASPAPMPWTADALVRYLRDGFDRDHGLAAGPMAPVVESLATVPEADVRAIAIYLADIGAARSIPREATETAVATTREFDAIGRPLSDRGAESRAASANGAAGERVFAGACATCHYANGTLPGVKPVPLALTSSVNAPTPRNALRIVSEGLHPASGEAGAMMPGFAGELTDVQIVAVVDFVRARFSDRAPWNDVEQTLRKIREEDLR